MATTNADPTSLERLCAGTGMHPCDPTVMEADAGIGRIGYDEDHDDD